MLCQVLDPSYPIGLLPAVVAEGQGRERDECHVSNDRAVRQSSKSAIETPR
jgi:hypothetical protein